VYLKHYFILARSAKFLKTTLKFPSQLASTTSEYSITYTTEGYVRDSLSAQGPTQCFELHKIEDEETKKNQWLWTIIEM
jgi:hypothetical protein